MKILHSFLLGSLFGATAVAGAIAIAQSEIDPVKLSPQYYSVRVDNDRLRVLEYRLGPGQKEPMHSHPAGIVYMLTDARLRVTTFPNGKVTEHDSHAGDLIWRDAVTHASENIGTSEARAIAIELRPCKQP